MRRVLKKNFWFNVHLILSLLCALPLLVVALSGCFISYHDEIFDAINERQSFAVQKDVPRLKISEILKIFGEKQSSFTPELIGIKDGGASIEVAGKDGKGRARAYFLSPYDGQIVGENYEERIMNVVLSLHTNLGFELAFGEGAREIGRQIVALSTLGLILLLLSGILIYYPFFRCKLTKALKINSKTRGYALLYQIHGCTGIYAAVILFAISASGLYFSYDWLARLTNKILGEEQIYKAEKFEPSQKSGFKDTSKLQEIDAVFEIFTRKHGENFKFFNIMLNPKDGVYSAIYGIASDESDEFNRIAINATSGEILRDVKFANMKAQMPRSMTIRTAVLDIHSGEIFGQIGKLIFCLSSLSFLFLAASGFWMSLKRLIR